VQVRNHAFAKYGTSAICDRFFKNAITYFIYINILSCYLPGK